MQKHLYQMTYWQSESGKYHVNDVKNLTSNSAKWFAPMRVLDLEVEEYIKLLLSFNALGLKYYDKTDYLAFYFKKEIDAKKFCSYVNKIAKNKQLYCD